MPEQSNDYRIIVFGAGSVGKSSLVLRFVKGTFSDSYVPTIEDTYQQVISCNRNVCTLQITDCSGSHQFPAMQQLNISKGHAFMLVYRLRGSDGYLSAHRAAEAKRMCLCLAEKLEHLCAGRRTEIESEIVAPNSVTSRQSLDVLVPIYQQIQEIKGGEGVHVPIMIVGNKCDEENREVKKELAAKLVDESMKDSGHMETSAKLDLNVQQAFQELLSMDKTRVMSLKLDLKKSRSQLRKEKLKNQCEIM